MTVCEWPECEHASEFQISHDCMGTPSQSWVCPDHIYSVMCVCPLHEEGKWFARHLHGGGGWSVTITPPEPRWKRAGKFVLVLAVAIGLTYLVSGPEWWQRQTAVFFITGGVLNFTRLWRNRY